MADNISCQHHTKTENSPLLSVQDEGKSSDGHLEVGKRDDDAKKTTTVTMLADVADTLHLAVPMFMARVSVTGMKTIDTALLGHVSGSALSAAALSDLWTMCTQVFIQGRVLSILVGQAIGANNYYLALVYLRISYFILGMLSIVVMISWCYTEQVWLILGQSRDIAKDAGYYSFVFIFSIPPQLVCSQLSQFLSAQRIMKPQVIASSMALLCNLVLGLALVLGIPFPGFDGFGFKACPIVTVSVVWFQCLFLYFYWVKCVDNASLARDSSSGNKHQISSWTEGITMERIGTYSKLYFPAALALSSDFWRMGVMGAIAASLGQREVGVFNASYRILWITLIFVGSLSGASGIKIAQRLGSGDVDAARQAAAVGVALVFLILLILSSVVFCNIRLCGSLFTNDESYLDLFEECRWPFTCVLFAMNFAVGIETIPISMGQTGNVFYTGFVASWLGQVPGVILLTRFWRHDLYAIYSGVAVGESHYRNNIFASHLGL
jgi:MATE family multidrug resistance protein